MDFYVQFMCRTFRHSPLVECAATQKAAQRVTFQMLWEDTPEHLKASGQVTEQEAWVEAGLVIDQAIEVIQARRARKGARFAALRAATERIDNAGRYAAWLKRRPRPDRRSYRTKFGTFA
jgi:hypothetical protein